MTTLLHEGPGIAVVLEDVVQQYGVEAMVRSAGGDRPVFCFATGTEALARLDPSGLALVVLAAAETDGSWPDEALAELGELGVRLLVLVDGMDEKDIAHASKLCGQGYLDRQDLDTATLSTAITDVLAGRLYVSATLARTLLGRAGRSRAGSPEIRGTHLTPRELQVLRLLAQGLSNKQVARRLTISEHGVKRLVSNILAKLNCPNRTMAVVRAMQEGLLVS
ncbi:response regulator transcription factor [Streptomyces parvus]|uniref:response regulator transcription factor n=1 Tax=Streptomyces parvus TaxID=66428 RepID=UPI0033293E7F|nr:response regulator transcription factor [Streptomyces globisporus]